jgi:uncharacterized protein YrrD
MSHTIKELFGFTIGATDGEIGDVTDVYFDDERWTIRYMVVATGRWLHGRKVLISPISVRGLSWDDAVMDVTLSRQQVRDSPSIDTDKPVSRQHETAYYNYYGYPNYWEGSNPWGLGMDPLPWVGASPDAAIFPPQSIDGTAGRHRQRDCERPTGDCHLRSSNQVIGYEVMATDGPVGTVEDFVFDDSNWAIRHAAVDTRKWLRGQHVLLRPESIIGVSWPEHEVYVNLTREAVETSPEYVRGLANSAEEEAAPDEAHRRARPKVTGTRSST